ncbi:MAG: 4Fe-4S binding protein [Acutalibacteraceae bacterium]|jgi:MinD superfamily P-loop ATPase
MKQLLILSGKGGTGKTTVASAFIKLSSARAYADCDVDAPNLHLVMNFKNESETEDYFGMPKAQIDRVKCIDCGVCLENCRFGAISDEGGHHVELFSCEGCGVCEELCPVGAAVLMPDIAGELTLFNEDGNVFSTAQLKMGRGTSGLLVTQVKNRMKSAADTYTGLAVIDGSPGIGCPVIASLSGVDMVLIVAEPSLSGISDMERIIKTAYNFGVPIAVCVNKHDTNPDNTGKIEEYCRENNLLFAGKIPFDPKAVEAINSGMTIADIDCPSGDAVREVYQITVEALLSENKGSGI